VLPSTTDQVARILAYCHGERYQGGAARRRHLASGGALPLVDGVLLGMAKFNRIREIDYDDRVVVAEPGVTNLAVTQASSSGLLLRPRSLLADRLHHRRQRGGELRRRALPQIRQ